MPDTTTSRVSEEDSVRLIGSKADNLDRIRVWYGEDNIEGTEAVNAGRRHDLVAQWYEWCDLEYPGTKPYDWMEIAAAAGEAVDIRLLIRAFEIAGYSILLVLEACYAVDRALCGTDAEALAKVEAWHMPQEMRAYKYLLSRDMILWWTSELTELEKEVRDPFSSQVYLSSRIEELQKCLARLEVIMQLGEGIGVNIWTTMGENFLEPPAGLNDAIDDRVRLLKTSMEILWKALKQSKQENVASNTTLPANHKPSELNGIRRRIPHAASSSATGHDLGTVQSSSSNDEMTTALDVPSSIRVTPPSPPEAKLPTPDLQHLQSLFVLAMSRSETFRARYKVSGFLEWFRHGETACIVTLCSVAASVFLLGWSAMLTNSQSGKSCEHSPSSDPNFIGNISQSILSILSSYLVVATTVHSGSVGLRYKFWFWLWLCASVLFSVLGLSLYTTNPLASTVLLWAAAFAQIVVPLLFVIKSGAIERSKGDDVESHAE